MYDGNHPIVAVVDDDDGVRDSIRFLLETAGFSVTTFASASQFLEAARSSEPACLVVDQHMPEITGLQLVTQLRSEGLVLPIALITGSISEDLIHRAQQLGIQTVLEKPLADDVLLDFIEKAAA